MENIQDFLIEKKGLIDADQKACEELEEKKIPFTQELADKIWNALSTAPESQMAAHLIKRAADFNLEKHTLLETWDFIIAMSKENEISPFISSLCYLEPHYKKPT